jgi:DNA-binding CsgD family transcriptional regulator
MSSDIQTRIEGIRTALLECMSFADLAAHAAAIGRLVDSSQTLAYRCQQGSELAFLSGSLAPFMPAYAPYYPSDPVHPYMRSQPNTFVLFRPAWKDIELSPAYSAFYREHDVHYILGVRPTPIRYGEPGMLGFLFTRSRRQPNFDVAQAEAVAALEPDMRAAWRRSQRTSELRRDSALLPQVAVQKLQTEVVALLDAHGALGWITPGAERLWRQPASMRLTQSLAQVARDTLAVHGLAYPLPVRGMFGEVPVSCDIAVSSTGLDEPCCRVRLSIDVARRVALQHGLTPSQARTLVHLAKGSSTRSMAAALRVSEHTIRSHVAQIRQKTGLRSRSEVLARYSEMPFFELR